MRLRFLAVRSSSARHPRRRARRRRPGRRARPVRPRWAPQLLLVAVIVAPVIGGIGVVVQRAGPFDTPNESASLQRLTGVDIARLVRYSRTAVSALAIGAGSRYVAAAYTSALASPLIYASGEEILPIGGFDGRTPEPSSATLRADVASGALHTVLVVTTRDPRVAWVVENCRLYQPTCRSFGPITAGRRRNRRQANRHAR